MIDEEGGVLVGVNIGIAASPADVWAAMADVGRWPEWNDRIGAADLHGPLAEGSLIHGRTTGKEIDSRLLRIEEPSRIERDGTVGAMKGLHDREPAPDGDGAALRIVESMSGGAASEDPGAMTGQLRVMLHAWGSA